MEQSDNSKFCLKWNNFQNNFMSQFEALKEDEDFVDVTLSCYGQSIKAHKVVLSACSPYLKHILKEHPCKHPVIILDNLSFRNLESVIQFVYTGQVYVERTDLTSFLKAAEALQIRGLSQSSSTQNLVEPVFSQTSELDNDNNSKKRKLDDEDEVKKLVNKRLLPKNSCDSEKSTNGASEVEGKEVERVSKNDNRQEENNASSSLSLKTEMECSLENDKRELGLSSRAEEYFAGEYKKPHWLDPRSCPLCNRVYSNLSNLRQHMKLIHNPTLATCRLCYKTFKTDLYLRRHLISFHEITTNSNNALPVEPFKPIQNQPSTWNQTIKTEPDGFSEIFNTGEIYNVPE